MSVYQVLFNVEIGANITIVADSQEHAESIIEKRLQHDHDEVIADADVVHRDCIIC